MLEFIRSKAQGWFAWILVSVIIAAFALFGIEQYLSGGGEAHIATVNGKEISQARLQQAYLMQRQRLQEMFGESFDPEMFPEERMREQILEGLIQQELLTQAASDAGLRISDAQLGELIREVPAFQEAGKFSQERYERAVLEQEGLSFSATEERARQKIVSAFEMRAGREIIAQQLQIAVIGSELITAQETASMVALRKQTRDVGFMVLNPARYESQISVADDEINRYYDDNAARFTTPELISVNYVELSAQTLAENISVSDEEVRQRYESQAMNYRTAEERKARHILIRVAKGGDAKTEADAKAKIEALLARVRKGESFAQLAKDNSEDPGSKAQGGDLGFFGRGMMDPAFETATFALKKGEVSEPVRSSFGFHIIQLDDVRGGIAKPLSEVRSQIVSEIRQEQADQRFYELAGKLGNLAYEHPESLDEASNQLGLRVQQSEFFPRSGGTKGISSSAKVVTAAFSDEVMKSGNNSEALEVDDKHLVVIRLREHQPEKRRALDDVKGEIVAHLKKEKAKSRTEEVADTLLSRLGKGEDPKVLAKEAGVEWKRMSSLSRDSRDAPQAIVMQAFRMPRPGADTPTSAKAPLQEGAQALLALYGVTTPKVSADDVDLASAQRQLQQAYAEASFESLLGSVKAKATIKR